jgi:hypothetical protein
MHDRFINGKRGVAMLYIVRRYGLLCLLFLFIRMSLLPTFAFTDGDFERRFSAYREQYPMLTLDIYGLVYQAGTVHDIDEKIILAFIDAESRFNSMALSPAGARGLMQVMPFWYRGGAGDLYGPYLNIMTGTAILKQYLKLANGNLLLAAQYYNAGPNGRTFNGPYIIRIVENLARSSPETPLKSLVARL